MKHLLIIGARGWGREVYNMLPKSIGFGAEFGIKGFLDDKFDALDGMAGYPGIVDSVENYEIQPDDVFVCALGDTYWKKHYVEMILNKGGEFINIIDKTVEVGINTRIGRGCIIMGKTCISCDIEIGDFVTIQPYVTIGHDARIGDFCHIGNGSFMGGYSELGEMTTMQTRSIVLPHVKVGNSCMVGAGAVVIKKVKDGDTVFGNPAKVLRY